MRGDLADFRGGVLCGHRTRTGHRDPQPCLLPATSPYPQLFNDAIRLAVSYKHNSRDFMDEVLQELEVGQAEMLGGLKKTASLQRDVERKPVGGTCSLCLRPWKCQSHAGQIQGQASPTALSTEL